MGPGLEPGAFALFCIRVSKAGRLGAGGWGLGQRVLLQQLVNDVVRVFGQRKHNGPAGTSARPKGKGAVVQEYSSAERRKGREVKGGSWRPRDL